MTVVYRSLQFRTGTSTSQHAKFVKLWSVNSSISYIAAHSEIVEILSTDLTLRRLLSFGRLFTEPVTSNLWTTLRTVHLVERLPIPANLDFLCVNKIASVVFEGILRDEHESVYEFGRLSKSV